MKLIRSVALQPLTPTHNEISFVFYRKSINCMNATSKFRFKPFFPFVFLFILSVAYGRVDFSDEFSDFHPNVSYCEILTIFFLLCNFWSVATFRQIYSQNIVSDICSFWIIFLGFRSLFLSFPFFCTWIMNAKRLLKYLVKELCYYYFNIFFINFYNICSCLYLTKSMINKNIHLKCHHAHLQFSLYN